MATRSGAPLLLLWLLRWLMEHGRGIDPAVVLLSDGPLRGDFEALAPTVAWSRPLFRPLGERLLSRLRGTEAPSPSALLDRGGEAPPARPPLPEHPGAGPASWAPQRRSAPAGLPQPCPRTRDHPRHDEHPPGRGAPAGPLERSGGLCRAGEAVAADAPRACPGALHDDSRVHSLLSTRSWTEASGAALRRQCSGPSPAGTPRSGPGERHLRVRLRRPGDPPQGIRSVPSARARMRAGIRRATPSSPSGWERHRPRRTSSRYGATFGCSAWSTGSCCCPRCPPASTSSVATLFMACCPGKTPIPWSSWRRLPQPCPPSASGMGAASSISWPTAAA